MYIQATDLPLVGWILYLHDAVNVVKFIYKKIKVKLSQ
jgi:hypothetical protein